MKERRSIFSGRRGVGLLLLVVGLLDAQNGQQHDGGAGEEGRPAVRGSARVRAGRNGMLDFRRHAYLVPIAATS
jgi:hypothetical protein